MEDSALHEEEDATAISPTSPSSSFHTVIPAPDPTKSSRQPRWSRQETFILIQAKKVVENNLTNTGIRSPDHHHEPKWETISSYCIQHGAIKSPAQCRKKWDHLAGDFRKIKTWEGGAEGSYWSMRGEARKERRLPGLFDRDVFDALDGKQGFHVAAFPLALFTSVDKTGADEVVSDFEETAEEDGGGARFQEFSPPLTMSGTEKHRNPCSKSEHGERKKRPRGSSSSNISADSSVQERMIRVLERNNKILSAQIEAQKMAGELERAQRRNETKSLVSAIGKISDALVSIVNKLSR